MKPLPITHPCDREPVRAIVLRFAELVAEHSKADRVTTSALQYYDYRIKRDNLVSELERALRP